MKKLPGGLLLLLASSCAVSTIPKGMLVESSIGEPKNIVPYIVSDSASYTIVGYIFNGLLEYDPSLRVVGDLAESYKIKKGGLEVILKLRKNIRWHDGAPFTADDVIFTFNLVLDPRTPTSYRSDYEKIKTIEKIDDYTVKITFKEPFAPFLETLMSPILPSHLAEKMVGMRVERPIAKPEELRVNIGDTRTLLLQGSPFAEHPIGTGPFKFVKWKRNESILLEAYQNYHKGTPKINKLLYRIIPDQAAIFNELKARRIDLAGLTPLQFARQTGPEFEKFYRKLRYPSWGYTFIGFNLKKPIFKDIRVRKALAMAVDRDTIIKTVLYGLGQKLTGPFVPQSWAYNKKVKEIPYDPEGAAKLLEEAGWIDRDGDGIRENEKGEKLEFTLTTNQGNDVRKKIGELVTRWWERIGVKAKLRIMEWSSFVYEYIDKGNFDAVILGWSLGIDPDQYIIWHSSMTSKEGKGLNFIFYSNPRVDKLLEEGRKTFDRKKRAGIYREIHRLIAQDVPYIFLFSQQSLVAVSKRFKGIKPTIIGIKYNIHEWKLAK